MKTRQWSSVLFVLMILVFTQTQALAGAYSGNYLVALMREHDKVGAARDFVKAREYGAYIAGVYDATEHLYNVPAGMTIGQFQAIVSNYLKNHPEEWNEPAAYLVKKALKKAFP